MIDDATAAAILAHLEHALAAPARHLRPLRLDTAIAGWLDDDRAARVADFADVFAVNSDSVSFLPGLGDESSRSDAMAKVTATLAAEGALSPWRNELYAAAPTLGARPWFVLERAAARYFGVHTWAAHINGVVRDPSDVRMWFARRSATKAIDPGKLDNLVGGGVAAGTTVAQTLAREAWEEAGIAGDLAARAQRKDAVHIFREQHDGLQSETLFVYDLWLASTFVPANQDGEAVDHRLVELADAARLVALAEGPGEVTAEAGLVVLDFLLRQRAIDPSAPAHDALGTLRHPQAAARRA